MDTSISDRAQLGGHIFHAHPLIWRCSGAAKPDPDGRNQAILHCDTATVTIEFRGNQQRCVEYLLCPARERRADEPLYRLVVLEEVIGRRLPGEDLQERYAEAVGVAIR
jgi:hypothetical protein